MTIQHLQLRFRRSRLRGQRGAATVEYAVAITFVVLLLLTTTLAFVNPGRDLDDPADDNVLPKAYKAVSDKVRTFQTIDE